jgi:hypothetical protein
MSPPVVAPAIAVVALPNHLHVLVRRAPRGGEGPISPALPHISTSRQSGVVGLIEVPP